MRKRLLAALALSLLLFTGCGTGTGPAPNTPTPPAEKAQPVELIVSAAASMTNALQELQKSFEAENAGVTIRFNFGSSGALQKQIEQGAPADLFISASKGPMDELVKKELVEKTAVTNVVSNKVVLIRSKTGEALVKDWSDLANVQVKRIAVGNPQHVPVGQYTKAVLEHLDLWSKIESRLVLGEDVRQVLNYVESGEVQAGIVYSTDAAISEKVVVVTEAPAGSHKPVVYPMAVLKGSKNAKQAEAFAQYLNSEKGQAVLAKYGFGPGEAPAATSGSEKAVLEVVAAGKTKGLTLAELKKLPTKESKTQKGAKLNGPTLKALLETAGVKEFKELVITAGDGFTATLAPADVTDEVVVGLTDSGITQIGGPNLGGKQSPQDPRKIEVK